MTTAPKPAGTTGAAPPRPLRVLIADDEPLARERLKRLLAAEPGVEVVVECTNGDEAVAAIGTHDPDLALLDIRMPLRDGFDVVRTRVDNASRPVIVFVTAHESRASQAFDLGVADYLLKPCTPARLRQTLQRVRECLTAAPDASVATSPLQRLIVRMGERMIVVPTDDVDWMESANNYVVLHAGHTTHVVRETLSRLETRLAAKQFMRISRFAAVNLRRVREILPSETDGHLLVLNDGTKLPVTRSIREIQARLELG